MEAKDGEEELRAELEVLDGETVDCEELRSSLEEFTELWEELFPVGRRRCWGCGWRGWSGRRRLGLLR